MSTVTTICIYPTTALKQGLQGVLHERNALTLTTAMIVPNTQDLMHDVTMSHVLMARQAESNMTLADTPYTVSAKPTLAANPALHCSCRRSTKT